MGIKVNVYKNNKLLKELQTIKDAAHFMKVELGREKIPWAIINNGIHKNVCYKHNDGSIFSFNILNKKINNNEKNDILFNTEKNSPCGSNSFNRKEFIEYLSKHLEQIIQLKSQINDQRLKKYHLSSKGLGEDLYYLTESYHRQKNIFNGKYSLTDFITPTALDILQKGHSQNLIFEHIVPKNIYLNTLVKKADEIGTLNFNDIYNVLMKYYYTCTVTAEEDILLPSKTMPECWDGQNPFYRYQLVGIKFLENPKKFK